MMYDIDNSLRSQGSHLPFL